MASKNIYYGGLKFDLERGPVLPSYNGLVYIIREVLNYQ